MTIELVDGGRGYVINYRGPLSLDEVTIALELIVEQEDFVHCRYIQHDLSRATRTLLDRSKLRLCAIKIASLLSRHPVRQCVICDESELSREFSQPFELAQIYMEDFATRGEASIWADAVTGFADLMDEVPSMRMH